MKTTYSHEDIQYFLVVKEHADPESIAQLQEGHISQALRFETIDGEKLVLRIAETDDDFRADKYVYDTFGAALHVPKITEIGVFSGTAAHCISELALGKTTDALSSDEMERALPSIQNALAAIFLHDISNTTGYGHPDLSTGNASYSNWKEASGREIEERGIEAFRTNASNIGLDGALIDKFFIQFRTNLPCASEQRRLLHGDPAFNNMLVDNDQVTAIIDWAQFGYGDWMSDFARLDFWHPGRYGDSKVFATKYGLDANNLQERKALYWATNALWTIEFADKAKNTDVTHWLQEYVATKLV